jgi:hypothetical protein
MDNKERYSVLSVSGQIRQTIRSWGSNDAARNGAAQSVKYLADINSPRMNEKDIRKDVIKIDDKLSISIYLIENENMFVVKTVEWMDMEEKSVSVATSKLSQTFFDRHAAEEYFDCILEKWKYNVYSNHLVPLDSGISSHTPSHPPQQR